MLAFKAMACRNTIILIRELSIFPTTRLCYVFPDRRSVLRARAEKGFQGKGGLVLSLGKEDCSGFSGPTSKAAASQALFNTADTLFLMDESLKNSFQRTDLGSFRYSVTRQGLRG